MDKNKINNSFPGDLDDLHVKDHLNASFDMENLTVSEDLIARTLKAIEESKPQEEQSKESNKIKHFPVRRLVSAAAVVLVLIVGINVLLQNGFTGNKTGSEISMDSSIAEGTAGDAATMEIYSAAAADDGASLNSTKSSEGTESPAAESDMAADSDINQSSGTIKDEVKKSGAGGTGSVLSGEIFSELFPINYDTVENFTLSKNDKTSKTFTDISITVNEFYNLMDGYPLTVNKADENGNTSGWTYKAEIKTPDGQTYTILIGDVIQVEQTSESNEAQVLVYTTDNMENLIKQIQDFYTSLNK